MSIKSSTRTLRVAGAAMPQWNGESVLTPVRLEGTEAVNSLFEYTLLLKTSDDRYAIRDGAADLKLNEFVGREVTVFLAQESSTAPFPRPPEHGPREITGLVTSARFVKDTERHAYYELVLRPWLHLATLTRDCRVFQNKNVVEILDELLADYYFPVHKRLSVAYPPRDIQTQLNESDAEFFMRLCAEWGINFHFEHSEGGHRLVLGDCRGSFHANPEEASRVIHFHDSKTKRIDEEYVHEFTVADTLTSGSFVSRDYDYTRPGTHMEARESEPRDTAQNHLEVFDWRGDGGSDYSQPLAGAPTATNQTDAQGRLLARLRMEALRQQGERARGAGQLRGMLAGHTFHLVHHPHSAANREYLIVSTTLLVEDVAEMSQSPATATAQAQQWRVHLDFEALPESCELRPELRPKPRSHGPETALVVGPNDAQGRPNNIHTEPLGRVKVQFHWDRRGEKNHDSSCWVRVSSDWAGNRMGAMHLPRVGQEVIVSFIGGDPDLPIITGRVFNQNNMPPWSLSDQQALSGFRSRELVHGQGNCAVGRGNHLILDDTEEGIQAQLKSDHQHSQLSLGHITRIEDTLGRKDHRGAGFELRSDGPGAVRASEGLLLTTEGREAARAHVLDMSETLQHLTQARDQHESLASLARQHQAQDADGDQTSVSEQLKAQNDALRGAGAGKGAADGGNARRFPEMTAPHLALASAAGLEAAAADTLHLVAGEHIAATSGGHTSVSSGKSFLVSAGDALRLFAHKCGIRIFAGKGPVQVQAQDDRIELIAQRALELISTMDWIRLKAMEGISFEVGGSKVILDAGGFKVHTQGVNHAWAADHQSFGPKSLRAELPKLPESACIPCMLKSAKAGSAITQV